MLAIKSKHLHRSLSVLILALAVAVVAGCAAPRSKSGSRGIGKPPREEAPVVYKQQRTGPLITPETDPFAVH